VRYRQYRYLLYLDSVAVKTDFAYQQQFSCDGEIAIIAESGLRAFFCLMDGIHADAGEQ
jgi:hypothetical protein